MASGDIAIIGMACRFAGDAKSPEAFHAMLQKGKDAWTKISSSRFNVEAFRHPSKDRSGSIVCEGGYFLEQDVSKWDAPFFTCSASEARSYDPQQRLLLELAYESLESAGIPITDIANTDAACFVGAFSEDYKLIVSRDIHATPQYAKTGTSLSILSNRISWFYNLRGPSVTCDTACSSSMAALHIACETIRSDRNPTRCALVGGANLILDPNDYCGLSALGFLSPQGRCFSFDARADGYARGEGVAMIVLKHMDDALRDGDPIRAVIRGTGLNSDGRTAGITLPSAEAQARLIVNTYRMANLDPADTQYVELHGTGTKAGDSAEVRAISHTIATARSQPLYCGSVKSRVGHTEAAAGMAAIIKSVLCLENGVITPNLNLATVNPRLMLDSHNMLVPTSSIAWPDCDVRRCSINNFGFGGTNAHVILDDAYNYLRLRGKLPRTIQDRALVQPRVFILSAPEQAALARQRSAHADYVESTYTAPTLPQLARTLSERRSVFQWRHAVVASSAEELSSAWRDDTIKPVKAATTPNVAFIFTGQGAQWYGMGRELVCFPPFADSVRRSAACLADLGCAWDAWAELMLPKSDVESKVKQAEYSQPLCLILQIALVDLAAYWNIKPMAVVGHSSGEMAAAYAAGALSREDSLKIAYHRGLVSKMAQVRKPGGGMMAVGLSVEDVQPYIARTGGAIGIACVNSPDNVTLAGDRAALEQLKEAFAQEKTFCRLLQVENAYHSSQMLTVSADYKKSIEDISPRLSASSVAFYSTVYGRWIPTSELTADYWVQNLCSTVQFVDALDDMMYASVGNRQPKAKSKAPSLLFEVGPHSTLAGAIRQYKANRDALENLIYDSILVRAKDASRTAVGAAGTLWTMGVPVKLDKVNNVQDSAGVLTDLPTYQWNHSTSYWHESRQSRNHRRPQFARHDLIGSRLESYNPIEPVWKNHLRVSDLPWLLDHKIHGDIVFPAAGMICSAVEAARQIAATEGSSADVSGFEFRELSVSKALVIPNNDIGVEVHINLKRRKLGDTFVEHAAGLLRIQYSNKTTEVDGGREDREEIVAYNERWNSERPLCLTRVPPSSHYNFCEEQGLQFGKTFQGLRNAYQNGLTLAFETMIQDTRACMPAFKESDYVIHPATLDAVFQSMMITVPRMDTVEKQAWVPTSAGYLFVSNGIDRSYGATLKGLAESSLTGVREVTASILIRDRQEQALLPAVIIDDFKFTGLGSIQKMPESSDVLSSKLYAAPVWKPDVKLIDDRMLRKMSRIEDDHDGMVRFCAMSDSLIKQMCRLALAKLGPSINAPLPPHLLKYAEWMERRCGYKATGIITPPNIVDICKTCHPSLELPDFASFIEQYPVDGRLAQRVYLALGAIFAQETTPIATLRQDDLLAKAYQDTYGLQLHSEHMQTWFALRAHKQPTLRVIEIGAGTASSTLPLLQRLSQVGSDTPLFSSWTFTDISAGWFENARTVLRDWEGRVEYKVLDIDRDPIEQGFEAGSYDVVLAVNVLHATKSIHRTLQHCHTLLKADGNLVLGEYTNPNDLASFVFGIMPGWWAAEDGRQEGPLLRPSQWHESLLAAGFSGADISLGDNDDPTAYRLSTIISTKTHKTSCRDVVIVVPPSCGISTSTLASDLCRRFQRLGNMVAVKDLTTAVVEASGKSVISLLDYEAPFFQDVSKDDFEHAKHLLLHSQELLWVTRSDPEETPGHPAKRMMSGVMRCVKMEDSSRLLYEFHLSRLLDSDIKSTGAAVCKRLCTIWDTATDENTVEEMETEEREGLFHIPRHMPYTAMNDSLTCATQAATVKAQIGNLCQLGRPLKLSIGHPGMLDTLHFVDDDAGLQPLKEQEVEIEVKACALNFLDIMIAMGQIQRPDIGHEACGTVTRVGSKTTDLSCGDRVLFVGPGAMRTHIRAHESVVQKLPDNMSFEDGASIPIAYATAYRSLVEVARLEKGESVLIHAAAGGLGQALIQIAKMLQAEIYCTVGSSAKKQAVVALGVEPDRIFSSRDLSFAKGIKRVTRGRGVDVVVNSLAGEALRQSWDCLAPYGRFIEVGKKDILGNSGLDMKPFVNNTVFAGVNLEAMMIDEPLRCRKLVAKVLKLFEQGAIDYIHPMTVRDFTEVETVFREMQRGSHIGKLILQATAASRVPIRQRAEVPLRLKSDATYLLVGGLGGLGRAQAVFMAENGARHIAFISRSGAARTEGKKVLDTLKQAGVEAKAYAGDVADKVQLRSILHDISHSMPPIRGVIQGAMVLADSLFHRMSYDQWVTATRPKVQGTWNLHELLPTELDFFIVLSSLAGIIGSVSQANYAAGNTFQDALVHYRRQKGLAAQSLDLGMMKGIGYVEEHQEARVRTSQVRVTSIEEQQFMHALRCALSRTVDGNEALAAQILVGAGSGGLQQLVKQTDDSADFYWLRSLAAFSYLQQMDIQRQDAAGGDGQEETSHLPTQLTLCKSMDEANDMAQQLLLAKIAKHISVPATDINTDKPIHAYGVDSLVAVELRNWLSMELKSELTIFDLTGSDPISEVTKKIASRSKLVPIATKAMAPNGS
ncbi:hypothetical protein ABOM_007875 [Aspergillus bombycis]|uniref:Uncharacterized protein n=1 Tax=Aspergillus bombycis TaxID=109264 RepID=A0A1F7ZTC7_9EURO|nr:hypothetical protein ABOM_007875 [Aspergillus bombycis]OGM42335.1 hypothetical protein ABOM_007875 [Aspergillus bombycis]